MYEQNVLSGHNKVIREKHTFNHALLESKIRGTMFFAQWWVLDLISEPLAFCSRGCCPQTPTSGLSGSRMGIVVHVAVHVASARRRGDYPYQYIYLRMSTTGSHKRSCRSRPRRPLGAAFLGAAAFLRAVPLREPDHTLVDSSSMPLTAAPPSFGFLRMSSCMNTGLPERSRPTTQ